MSDWVYITGGRELSPVLIDGLDVWKHQWMSDPREPVTVRDPRHGQEFRFSVYTMTDGHRRTTFAAGELSNGMWGFFQQRSNEESADGDTEHSG